MTARVGLEPAAQHPVDAPPLGKKRIVYRYWLAAIAVGVLIWAGIALGWGLI